MFKRFALLHIRVHVFIVQFLGKEEKDMLVSLKKFFKEKGQGLTEYVLILAFVAGVAYMMFAESGLKSTVSSTFGAAQSKIESAAQSALQ